MIPRVTVSDGPAARAPQPVLTLDGAPFAAGAPIAAEGDHLLVATGHRLRRPRGRGPRLLPPRPHRATAARHRARRRRAARPRASTPSAAPPMPTSPPPPSTAAPRLSPAGAFTLTPFAWREGENVVSVELVDAAGNRAAFERRFTVRSLEPTLEMLDGRRCRSRRAPSSPGRSRPMVRCSDPEPTISRDPRRRTLRRRHATSTPPATTRSPPPPPTPSAAPSSPSVELPGRPRAGPTVAITSPGGRRRVPRPRSPSPAAVDRATPPPCTVNGLPAAVDRRALHRRRRAARPPTTSPPSWRSPSTAPAVPLRHAVTVIVRPGAPQVLILEPADGAVTNRAAIDVAGVVVGGPDVTADGTVTVAGLPRPIADDGTFRVLDVPLFAAPTPSRSTATDDAGRTGSRHRHRHRPTARPPRVALHRRRPARRRGRRLPGRGDRRRSPSPTTTPSRRRRSSASTARP